MNPPNQPTGRSLPRAATLPAGLAAGLLLVSGVLPAGALPAHAQTLGPADGHDLPAADLERVMVGAEAPLFTLESFDRGPVELAGFRGDRNVVLVFYRGHW